MPRMNAIDVPLELTMTPTSKEMVRQLVADVLMEAFPRVDSNLVECEIAKKILGWIDRTEQQLKSDHQMLETLEEVSRYSVLVDGIKELCGQQIKKASAV